MNKLTKDPYDEVFVSQKQIEEALKQTYDCGVAEGHLSSRESESSGLELAEWINPYNEWPSAGHVMRIYRGFFVAKITTGWVLDFMITEFNKKLHEQILAEQKSGN